MITEERLMVMQAVLDGKLGTEHVTIKELTTALDRASNVVFNMLLACASARGCMTFSGAACKSVH